MSIQTNETTTEPVRFFQNEPIPLASSIVDDLTTLASAIYIISLFIIVFIFLAWITHYNAPCSSMITSILSTITGLPEPIIHSVALCGSCCVWCETTWLFRRIHRFNQWISNKIKQFFSVTCKVLYDTICPCCRPLDTPSNRSIIGSLPTSIIAMINVSEIPSPKTVVNEPRSVTVNVDLHPPSRSIKSRVETSRLNRKKRRKQPRKRTQSKQRSAMNEISEQEQEENIDEEEDDDESDEDAEIY